MKVLVAGSTGAIGIPTVRELIARDHEVFGLTRSKEKAARLERVGARPVFGDVFDATAMDDLVRETEPDGVVQVLNAIPKRGAFRPSELDATNELRIAGTQNLLSAAIRHGSRRYLVESMIFGYGYGDRGERPLDEDAPFGAPVAVEQMNPALNALSTMEKLVIDASTAGDIEGIVLRLGLFYGPEVGSTEFMATMLRRHMLFLPGGNGGCVSWIHVEDGARAFVDALERAPAGAIYNVVDDEPTSISEHATALAEALGASGPKSVPVGFVKLFSSYVAAMAETNLRISNERIKREIGWKPEFSTIREGIGISVAPRLRR